jgi:hypothetical protein
MRKHVLAGSLVAMTALSLAAAGANAQSGSAPAQCFYSQDWDGWKASPDSKMIYIRVGVNRIYRLDLANACPELQEPNAHLVNHLRGTSEICSPLDLDLSVAVDPGFKTPCIVSKLTPLSKEQASALPKELRP